MAQTKRKRRTKHRGNAAGTVEARGRTGRKPTPEERKQGRRRRERAPSRLDRRADVAAAPRPRAGLAAVMLFVLFQVGLRRQAGRSPASLALALLAFLLYVPLGYYTDRCVLKRRMRKAGRALPRKRQGRALTPMDVRMFTVGPVQENCHLARRDGARPRRCMIDPGDEADRLLAADRRARRRRRRDPAHAHALRPRRRRRAGRRARPARRSTARSSRCPCSPTSCASSRGPGFGPFESYDADHTVAGGERLELAGLGHRRALHARPQPGPRDLLRSPTSRRVFSGDVLFQGSIGRTDLPGGDTADADAHRSPSCSTPLPDETTVHPGHMGLTTLGRERATNPFLAQLAHEPPHPGAARHVRRAARRRARARRRSRRHARRILERAGYGRIETPVFEATELFARGVGASTDIVQKEMYTFDDGGGRSLTLRPEGTAPVCRAYLEHGMHKLPAAGEALVPVELLPPRARRRPAATASSGRSARRRSAPTTRPSTPR